MNEPPANDARLPVQSAVYCVPPTTGSGAARSLNQAHRGVWITAVLRIGVTCSIAVGHSGSPVRGSTEPLTLTLNV